MEHIEICSNENKPGTNFQKGAEELNHISNGELFTIAYVVL